MGLGGFPVRVPLLVSSILFSSLLKNSQNTKVDNYTYLEHFFFYYHALFRMSPMDELPGPSDSPTTSTFSGLPRRLGNSEYSFLFNSIPCGFAHHFYSPKKYIYDQGRSWGGGVIGPPHPGGKAGFKTNILNGNTIFCHQQIV